MENLINALKRFDASFSECDAQSKTYDQLFSMLEEVASETDFTAEELLEASEEGF